MNFLKKKVLKFLHTSKVVDIGLKRPSTLPQVIVEVVDIDFLKQATLTQVITEDMLLEVDIVHKRPATLTLEMREQ